MIRQIPNVITSLNLLSGCFGLVFLMQGQTAAAAAFIFIAALLDFLDGTAARLLNARTEIGKQLDSLADVVSFGVLPGLIMYRLVDQAVAYQYGAVGWLPALPWVALVIPVFSALRLGKFNIDPRQAVHFRGLPTPANALFLGSFPLIVSNPYGPGQGLLLRMMQFLFDPFILGIICLLSAILLISEVPLFSLKFKTLSLKDNLHSYLFLLFSLALLAVFALGALILIIPLYVLLSVLFRRRFMPAA